MSEAIVCGAGAAGLASAACLKRAGIPVTVLERGDAVGTSWRRRYDGLRLNTLGWMSTMPGYRANRRRYGEFPARDDWIRYLSLAEHERPQPRRGLRAACASASRPGRTCARAGGRGRGGDPAGRARADQGGAHPRDPRRARAATTSAGWRERADRRGARLPRATCPGVGRKTAACVLLFSFGRHDVPVDTHVYRVGTRLGLFRPRRLARGGARRDAAAVPGRATPTRCTCCSSATAGAPARRAPRAARECPLRRMCPEGRRRLGGG